MTTINLVSGDNRPSIELTLTREDTGNVIDLSQRDRAAKVSQKRQHNCFELLSHL